MAVDSVGRPEESHSLRRKRAGALLFGILGVVGLLWWLEERTSPGQPVDMVLQRPGEREILRPGQPVLVQGRVKGNERSVLCNGVRANQSGGLFRVHVPGPEGPGLFILDCQARNDRGRTYHFRYGRRAGWAAPLAEPMARALTLTLPLSLLNEKGGLLEELDALLARHLVPLLTTKGTLGLGPYVLGPVWLSGMHVESVTTRVSGRVDFHILLERPCMKFGLRGKQRRTVCLPLSFRAVVGLSLTRNGMPVLHVGKVNTEQIRTSPWLPGIDLAAALAGMLSQSLGRAVAWPAEATRGLTKALEEAKTRLDEKLSDLSLVVPAVPKGWPAAGTRICFGVELSSLETNPQRDTATLAARVRITGYDPKGTCKTVHPFPKTLKRLLSAVEGRGGGPAMQALDGDDSLLVLSSAFVNAYFTALWAAGALRRVPLNPNEATRFGFSLEMLEMRLPPSLIPGEYLHIAFPEVGVWVRTLGEAKRYFVLSATSEITLLLSSAGMELAIMDSPPPRLWLRCEGELGRTNCAEQTHRYQAMVEMVLTMVKSGRLVLPVFPVARALPRWRTEHMILEPAWVRRWEDGIGIGLQVERVGPLTGSPPQSSQSSGPPIWPSGP